MHLLLNRNNKKQCKFNQNISYTIIYNAENADNCILYRIHVPVKYSECDLLAPFCEILVSVVLLKSLSIKVIC